MVISLDRQNSTVAQPAGGRPRENWDMFDEKNHAFTICACVYYVEDECGW
jgi:hypothetical protein